MWNNIKRTAALNIFVCGLCLAFGFDAFLRGLYWTMAIQLIIFAINALLWWRTNKNNSLWLEQWMAQHHLVAQPPTPDPPAAPPVIKPEPIPTKPINKYRDLDLGD